MSSGIDIRLHLHYLAQHDARTIDDELPLLRRRKPTGLATEDRGIEQRLQFLKHLARTRLRHAQTCRRFVQASLTLESDEKFHMPDAQAGIQMSNVDHSTAV